MDDNEAIEYRDRFVKILNRRFPPEQYQKNEDVLTLDSLSEMSSIVLTLRDEIIKLNKENSDLHEGRSSAVVQLREANDKVVALTDSLKALIPIAKEGVRYAKKYSMGHQQFIIEDQEEIDLAEKLINEK
jgi:hypothetical protein